MPLEKNMYELTYILSSILSDDQTRKIVDKLNKLIENAGGTVRHVDEWGSRRMAYPIRKKRNGYYVNMYFEGPGKMVARLERTLEIDDHIVRYLTLRMDKTMIEHYEARRRASAEAE